MLNIRRLTLLLAALIIVACVPQTPNSSTPIDVTKPIEKIDKELSTKILAIEKNSDRWGAKNSDVKAFAKALEHYLRYPQTYENDMPLLKEQMHIKKLPLSGNKLYSFGWYSGGTMGYSYNTYIQYRNENGDVEFVPFLNDLRYPSSFGFHEFCYDNTIYYLVEQYSRGSSSICSYYVAIISIKDGVITYHPEFFPDFKPGIEEYFTYDENGDINGNTERHGYFMYVCGAQNAENCNDVGFTFDPNTLTLTILDETDCSKAIITKSEMKLNTKFDVVDRGEHHESIVGDFNGDGRKEHADLYYKFTGEGGVDDDPIYTGPNDDYNVYFSDPSIKTLDESIIQWGAAYMTNEGDLNGDGADEIGLWIRGGYSSCGDYVVFTYGEEGWKDLVAIDHNPNWNPRDYQQLVRKHPKNPNWLIVDEVIWDDGRIRERIVDIRYVDTRKFRYERINLAVDNYVYIEGWWQEAKGFSGYYDVALRMSHCEGEPLSFYAGRISDISSLRGSGVEYEYDYYASIVTAPDNLFFFADIDFDGVKELITGITPFGSSQRNCSAFTTIYKLVDGKYKDVSESFATKCEAFKAIEPYYFSVNYARKEIIQYHDGGAMSGGWKVYTFAKRKYRYDRYVHYDFDDDGDMVTVTVDYSDKRPKKSMRMSSADFWAKKYTL